jgi:N-acetyltransferase
VSAFDFQPTLTGNLIEMRPYVDENFEALYAVASDPLIWEVHPVPERAQRPYFQHNIDDALGDKGGLVAIERSSGEIVGFSRYSQVYVGPDDMEIGWTFLSRHLWGGQHNRDMKQVMVRHALASFPRVIFRVGADNVRSRRAMTKIGGALIPWDETITALGRDMRFIAYEITRESFAAGPLST